MNTPYFPPWRRTLGPLGRRSTACRRHSPVDLESQFAKFLSAATLAPTESGPGSRDRDFPLSRVFWGFVWQVLHPGAACRTVVRQLQALCETETRKLDESTSAYCQGRQRLPLPRVQQAMREAAAAARQHSRAGIPGWNRPVKVADASCTRLPDTAENRAVYPYAGCQRPGCGFPMMKFLGLFCLASGAILEVAYDVWKISEIRLLLRLLARLQPGDILLGDRAYCAWFVLAKLPTLGVDVVARLNARRLTRPRRGRRLGPNDRLAQWDRPAACPPYLSIEEWEALPPTITVRLIRSRLFRPGLRTEEVWLVTTLLDPVEYPAPDIERLYLRRWQMELCLRDLKTTLGMEELRCRSPAMVHKELFMFLTAHNFIRGLIAQAATAHEVSPTRISFKGTLDTVASFHDAMRLATSKRRVRWLHTRMLEIIARDLVPYRPGRAEPRAVKRRPKPYQRLTKPRRLFRETAHRAKPRSKDQAPRLS